MYIVAQFNVCGMSGKTSRHRIHRWTKAAGYGEAFAAIGARLMAEGEYTVCEHDGHLQDRLDACADLVRGSGFKGFCAVSTLQEESLALGGRGQTLPKRTQHVHFAGEYRKAERRKVPSRRP